MCDNPHPSGKVKAMVKACPLMSSHQLNILKGNDLIKHSSIPMESSQWISPLQRFAVSKSAKEKGKTIAMEEDLTALRGRPLLLTFFSIEQPEHRNDYLLHHAQIAEKVA